jgi:hypothetical protein
MPAIDEPPPEASLSFGVLVEMHFRRVLVEAGGEHVVAFFNRHAVHMVDLLANLIIVPEEIRA